MQRYKAAAEEINWLVDKGRRYQKKLASVDLQHIPVYWNPVTGEFAVPTRMQKQAGAALYKCGSLPFTTFTNEASEDTGWVLLNRPTGYAPLRKLEKYASMLDTPAKLTMAGALLGGTGGLVKSLWDTSGQDLGWGTRLRAALVPMGAMAALGSIPGIVSGVTHSFQTRPYLPTGERGPREVGILPAMFMSPGELAAASPTYRTRQQVEGAQHRAFGKQASLIEVDAFNRTIWDDTQNGFIEPDNALRVSTTLNASQFPGTRFATPASVVGTLVNAGIGWATAGVIGKTLGAMSLMSDEGQQKLRDVGTWGGIINGMGNAITF